jgi:hypothetical protein
MRFGGRDARVNRVTLWGSEGAAGAGFGRSRLQKRRGRHEEQTSGDGAAEVEQPVVVAGRAADEHVLSICSMMRGERL